MNETLDKIDWSKIDFVIETGTYEGASSKLFRERCNKVYTIEISESLFAAHSPELEELGIHCILGASTDKIGEILDKEKGEFLGFWDAHSSGGKTGCDPRVGRYGSPIIEEIKALGNRSPRVLIIDDLRDCELLDGYPDPSKIKEAVLTLGDYTFEVVEKGNKQLICIRDDA